MMEADLLNKKMQKDSYGLRTNRKVDTSKVQFGLFSLEYLTVAEFSSLAKTQKRLGMY